MSLLLFTAFQMNAQDIHSKVTKKTATSYTYTVKSVEELQTIDWDIVKDFFRDNEDDEEITLGYRIIGMQQKGNQLKIEESFMLTGKFKDIDKLVKVVSNYSVNNK